MPGGHYGLVLFTYSLISDLNKNSSHFASYFVLDRVLVGLLDVGTTLMTLSLVYSVDAQMTAALRGQCMVLKGWSSTQGDQLKLELFSSDDTGLRFSEVSLYVCVSSESTQVS